ncbi:rab GTPase-binding effector protein 1-like isoform X2 [Paramacrobiotus metropolitanus]|uniref:rab GTPase-binding effector protein 1-like isoform X2 n=1 Tax=Paramacrobiotus metropolitanus TaxID=2943436 RepID=UPI0024457EC8|nr:rab GTPase-binding effector protein 1-like isoform X2 [Paramacrobiotus metropolitanus]
MADEVDRQPLASASSLGFLGPFSAAAAEESGKGEASPASSHDDKSGDAEDSLLLDVDSAGAEELRPLIKQLRQRQTQLLLEKQERDEEFGRHRAMFKEMYMQKEGEVGSMAAARQASASDYQTLARDFTALQNELAEIKAVAVIAESSSKEELDGMRRRYQQELDSMEQAMRATIEDAVQSTESKYQLERRQLIEANTRLKAELDELRRRAAAQSSPDRNGLLATLSRKVGVGVAASPPAMHPSASLQTLRSPSSEEETYNSDMKRAKDDADFMRSLVVPLEDEINVLRSQLHEAQEKLEYYEQEKPKLSRQTDDGLEQLTRKFGSKELDLSTASKGDIEMYLGVMQTQKLVLQEDAAASRRELARVQKLLEQEREVTQYFRRCLNAAPFSPSHARNRSDDSLDITRSDNVSLRSGDGEESPLHHGSPSLELEMSGDDVLISLDSSRRPTLASLASAAAPQMLMAGPSPVSGCAMCANYESTLQLAQKTETRLRQELDAAKAAVTRLKEDLKHEQHFREEMDRRVGQAVQDTQHQISELQRLLAEAEKREQEAEDAHQAARVSLEHILRDMVFQREQTAKELGFLEAENGRLTDRYTAEWRRMQEEEISLPTDVEELHHLLLKYREDVIRSRVAKEHGEDGLRGELLFLRDQLAAEQHNKDGLLHMLTKEADALRERLGILESEKSELERQLREVREKRLEEGLASQTAEALLLRTQLDTLQAERSKLDKDLHHSRSRAQALQVELDNSEAVQRDFVKLSQSLQVELEKIRQAENEVRWQLDEDVDECNACRQPFVLPRKKVRSLKIHCRHCGKIFCVDCLNREVLSGPHRRPVKVCQVCHTILNRDTAPYFSHAPPSPK